MLTLSTFRRIGRALCEALESRRLLAAGALDPSFAGDGTETIDFFGDGYAGAYAEDVAVQGDGKTVVVGQVHKVNGINSPSAFAVARFNLDGTSDVTFGPNQNGRVVTPFLSDDDWSGANAVAIQPDGKIVVGGYFHEGDTFEGDYGFAVARYHPGGTLDESFAGDGRLHLRSTVFKNVQANAITLDSEGNIYLAGERTGGAGDVALAVVRPDGSVAGTLSPGFGGEDTAWAIEIDRGKMVIVGTSFSGGIQRMLVARFQADGRLDESFDGDGSVVVTGPGGVSTTGTGLVVQPDGKYVAVGSSGGNMVMARFLPGGALDTTFGTAQDGWVVSDFGTDWDFASDIIASNTGGLVVAGSSGVAPDERVALARFSTEGVPDPGFGNNGQVVMTDPANPRIGASALAAGPGRRITVSAAGAFHFGDSFLAARFLEAGANLVAIGHNDPDGGSEAGPDNARFFVTRSEALPTPLRVYLNISGTATPPFFIRSGDYNANGFSISPFEGGSSVEIPANERTLGFSITPVDDSIVEGDETAVFTIAPHASYDIDALSSVTLVIHDNDGTMVFPVADAHVRDGVFANANFGNSTFMETKASSNLDLRREAYLKFDTSSIPTITSVKLRVFGRLGETGPAIPTEVLGVSNSSWTETGITFNNRPAPSTGTLATVTVNGTTEAAYDLDVTGFVQAERNAGRRVVSLLLRNTVQSTPVTLWGSRTWTSPPRLIINPLVLAGGPPRVTQVFVNSTAWSPQFRQHLEDTGLGDSELGISVRDGARQLDGLPWTNLDQVSVRFSRNVAVDAQDLEVRGVTVPRYELSSAGENFRYDDSEQVATWTLDRSFANDRIVLDLDGDAGGVSAGALLLDGDWADGPGGDSYPSGNDSPGGDFEFRLNALPGDAAPDGRVNALDLAFVKQRLNRTATNPGTGAGAYSVFADLTGDGRVNALDLAAVKQRLGRNLPDGDPTATALLR